MLDRRTGTQIEARDLFWNTPARLKFITRYRNCLLQHCGGRAAARACPPRYTLPLACEFPHRCSILLPPHRDMAERVRAALAHGARARGGRGRERSLRARLSRRAGRGTGHAALLPLNRQQALRARPSPSHALGMGYGELLEKGRYPVRPRSWRCRGPCSTSTCIRRSSRCALPNRKWCTGRSATRRRGGASARARSAPGRATR